MAPALVLPAPATNAAFFVVFGIFVVAMVVLIVIIIMWAVRHDIAGRRAWRERQEAAIAAGEPSSAARTRPAEPTHDAPSAPSTRSATAASSS